MCQWVLKGNGKVVPRRSVRPLNPSEIHSEVEIIKRNVFDELIERSSGTYLLPTISGRLDTEIHRIWLITLGNPMTKHFAYNLWTTIQYTFYLFLQTQ
jgi:hypothetical protein